jgi:hypothetical protein
MPRFLVLSLVCALVLATASASATVVVKLDLEQLVGRSDVIFVGKAIKTESHWTKNGRRIVTDTTFVVEEAIHGTSEGREIVVRRPGGTVDGIGMKVSGAVVYRAGDQALLFTERRAGSRYTVGMRQGAYAVFRDTSGNRVVQARLRGMSLAKRAPSGAVRMLEPQPDPKPEPLRRFIERVQKTVKLCAKESNRCRTR